MSDTNQAKSVTEYVHRIDPRLKAFVAIFLGLFGTLSVAWLTGDVFKTVFENLQSTALYYLLPFLVSGFLFTYLLYKTRVEKIFGLNFLALFVLAIGLADLFRLLAGGSKIDTLPYQRNGDIFPTLIDLMLPLAVLFLYLHIELLESNRPRLIRSVAIFSTALPLILGAILEMIVKHSNLIQDILAKNDIETVLQELDDVLLFYLYFFGLVILAISLDGLMVMYKTLTHADSIDVSRGSMLMMAGFTSLISNFVLIGLRDSISLAQTLGLSFLNDLNVHTSYIIMASLFIMFLAYVLQPSFAYSVPFDVYQIIVINRETGTTLFSFINEIRADVEQGKTQIALKSPAIVAIQTLLKEITYAEGRVHLIGMDDRILLLHSEEEITVVLIATQSSYFLRKGLATFTTSFYEAFKAQIVDFTGNTGVFKTHGTELLLKYFPFFRSESL